MFAGDKVGEGNPQSFSGLSPPAAPAPCAGRAKASLDPLPGAVSGGQGAQYRLPPLGTGMCKFPGFQ